MTLGPDAIPVAPFREAFERSELTANQVALRCGWLRHDKGNNAGDGGRVRRVLGLKQERSHGKMRWRNTGVMTYDTAVKLCEAMELDPVDMGV